MKDEEILELTEGDIQKIERVRGAKEKEENAKANHESKKGWRILYERAPAETLPFIIYSVYVVAQSIGVLLVISKLEGELLYINAALVALAIIAPLLVLPMKKLQVVIKWLADFFKKLYRKIFKKK